MSQQLYDMNNTFSGNIIKLMELQLYNYEVKILHLLPYGPIFYGMLVIQKHYNNNIDSL